jgi:hypothetical protein
MNALRTLHCDLEWFPWIWSGRPKHVAEIERSSVASLGAFSKFEEGITSFATSVRPSVRMEQLGSYWTVLHENRYLRIFRKFVSKTQVSLISDFTWSRVCTSVIISCCILLRMRNISKFVDKYIKYILYSVIFFYRKSFHLSYNMEKYCRVGHTTDYKIIMVLARFLLVN